MTLEFWSTGRAAERPGGPRAGILGPAPCRWRGRVDRVHRLATSSLLGGAALVAVAWPNLDVAVGAWGGAALLVGGAIIGVPHGSSDFVVAHRLLKPSWGRCWLPAFLVAYLAIVTLVLAAWCVAPLATLLAFLVASGLHFGLDDLEPDEPRRGLVLAVRATTPLLPVLLLHPGSVAGIVASLGGVAEPAVARTLDALCWPLSLPWAGLLACVTIPRILRAGPDPAAVRRRADAVEVVAIAGAAVVLPPLLAFALYFCLVHAVRHMVGIADDRQPHDARRAAFLVAAIVVPSALVCFAVLASTWTGIAGPLGTTDVITWAIRVIAALTAPHMALDALARRSRRRPEHGEPRMTGRPSGESRHGPDNGGAVEFIV